MLFCQMGRAHSLREICHGLETCEGKLSHLEISAPSDPPWPTPTRIVPGSFTRSSSSYAVITDGKAANVKVPRRFSFEPGTIVVDARGYTDYDLFAHGVGPGSISSPG